MTYDRKTADRRDDLRAELAAMAVGTCEECDKPISGLDEFCVENHRDGVFFFHALCIGCDHPGRGCDNCAGGWRP